MFWGALLVKLTRCVDDNDSASTGSAELRLTDDGGLFAHTTISWDVDVYAAVDMNTVVGVDLNDDPLTSCAVWSVANQSVV